MPELPFEYRPLPALASARAEPHPAEQLRALRKAAVAVRDALCSAPPVLGLATCRLSTFPFPTQFAFNGAAALPLPFVMRTARMFVVQFRDFCGATRTLLFNPLDYDRSQRAPFYAGQRNRYGAFLSDLIAPRHGTVQSHLDGLGLRMQDVDYLAFPSLQLQDPRGWLGAEGIPGIFPRARLLVTRAEWDCARDPHPLQASWYVPQATVGIPAERVELLDGDAWLGEGTALLTSPGHTLGACSLLVHSPRGLFAISGNAAATECYTPLQSRIPGLRAHAEQLGLEVIPDGSTQESGLLQYTTMVLEKSIAGPSVADPAFVNVLSTSELTSSVLTPGIRPSFSHGELSGGELRRPL